MPEDIGKKDAEQLVSYLRSVEDLGLNDEEYEVIRNNGINGSAFLKMSSSEFSKFVRYGPALNLAELVQKNLKKVSSLLHDSDDSGITMRYKPQSPNFDQSNIHFENCVNEISVRLKNYGDSFIDFPEAMRKEYVVAILHAAINIARELTQKDFKMCPDYKVRANDSIELVDFAFMSAGYLICFVTLKNPAQNISKVAIQMNKKKQNRDFDYIYGIYTTARDWKFQFYTADKTTQYEDHLLSIKLYKPDIQTLRNDVEEVLNVVVESLKQAASAEDPVISATSATDATDATDATAYFVM